MKLAGVLSILILILFNDQVSAQSTKLKVQIEEIISTKKARVGVSILGPSGTDTVHVHADEHFPLQSVFKFHISVVMLTEIDKGKFTLDQKINITQKDLTPEIWSPIREKYPNGTVMTLAEIMQYTLSQSDNVGCDILLKLLGGPEVIERFFHERGVKDLAIKINEEVMQNNWDMQFLNWTTPSACNDVLISIYNNTDFPLSKVNYDFLWKTMSDTETGTQRLKGLLPKGTVVAHKTGYSGVGKSGITEATNDVGVVYLPNGQHFFISVFITNSTEDINSNEKIIAEIAKAAWDYFN